jgi:hypothetical protein
MGLFLARLLPPFDHCEPQYAIEASAQVAPGFSMVRRSVA